MQKEDKFVVLNKTALVVRLVLLVGACRQKAIKKSQIEESLQRLIKDIESGEYDKKD